jgi:hypothetical protein
MNRRRLLKAAVAAVAVAISGVVANVVSRVATARGGNSGVARARRRRQVRRSMQPWSDSRMFIGRRHRRPVSIVRWPHQDLFWTRGGRPLSGVEWLPPNEWARRVQSRGATRSAATPATGLPVYFNRRHETKIREILALATLSAKNLDGSDFDGALDILRPILSIPRHDVLDPLKSDRILALTAKLLCVKHKHPQAAYEELKSRLEELFRRGGGGIQTFEMPPALSVTQIQRLHTATNKARPKRRTVRDRLSARIAAAQSILHSTNGSSSGKDTFLGERGSNPRPFDQPQLPQIQPFHQRLGKHNRSWSARLRKRFRRKIGLMQERFTLSRARLSGQSAPKARSRPPAQQR